MTTDKELYMDLCVIGAGAGGLSVASGAVQLGLDVALVEKGEMGGECLNSGCIPSKALLAAASAAQTMRTADKHGIGKADPDVNMRSVLGNVNSVINKIAPHDSQERYEGMGVKVFRAEGVFTSPQTLQAGDTIIRAKNFVIATGSRAAIPPIKGLEDDKILTNENLFKLTERPSHLAIIGGGPIGMEMAQAFRRLGSKVTLLDMGTVLPKDDPELAAIVRNTLEKEGVAIHEQAAIEAVSHKDDNSVEIAYSKDGKGDLLAASHLLIAAGRTPALEGLGLDFANVQHDKKGIQVDARLRTSAKHIYALGDCTNAPRFTHIASYQAGIIIRNLLFKIPAKVDYSALPWVTYTDPELAQVGLTETVAREQYGDKIHISLSKFKENDRAQAEKKTDGMIKVITLKNGRIIGASICGPHAGELTGLWSLSIAKKMKISAIAALIAPYPTLGEISKRAAGAYYTESLFSDKTRFFVGLLQRLPF